MNKLPPFLMAIILFMPLLAFSYTGVSIVISSPSQENQEFIDQFQHDLNALKNNSLRVKIIVMHSQEKLVVAENSELVIALGVKALEASSKLKHSTPVIGVFTPQPVFLKLLHKSRRDLGNFSSIDLDQPITRQLSLIKIILPHVNRIGVLLGENSLQYNLLIKNSAEKVGFNIQEENVEKSSDLIPKLKKLLQSSEALLAISDPLIYSAETLQPILFTSYLSQKPIFGYSRAYVRAGSLATVFSSTKQLANQVAEIAVKSHAFPGLLPPPQAPKYFSIMINYQVARSLNIKLLDDDTINKRMLEAEVKENEEFRH